MKWLIPVLCVALSCSPKAKVQDAPQIHQPRLGVAQWEYTNSDEAGNAVVKGLLTLPSPLQTGVQFSGTWQSHFVGKPGEENTVGPQLNFGRLSGELASDGQLRLQLNPSMVDNNVSITAQVAADSMKGTWEHDGFAGKLASGTFEASPAK